MPKPKPKERGMLAQAVAILGQVLAYVFRAVFAPPWTCGCERALEAFRLSHLQIKTGVTPATVRLPLRRARSMRALLPLCNTARIHRRGPLLLCLRIWSCLGTAAQVLPAPLCRVTAAQALLEPAGHLGGREQVGSRTRQQR